MKVVLSLNFHFCSQMAVFDTTHYDYYFSHEHYRCLFIPIFLMNNVLVSSTFTFSSESVILRSCILDFTSDYNWCWLFLIFGNGLFDPSVSFPQFLAPMRSSRRTCVKWVSERAIDLCFLLFFLVPRLSLSQTFSSQDSLSHTHTPLCNWP